MAVAVAVAVHHVAEVVEERRREASVVVGLHLVAPVHHPAVVAVAVLSLVAVVEPKEVVVVLQMGLEEARLVVVQKKPAVLRPLAVESLVNVPVLEATTMLLQCHLHLIFCLQQAVLHLSSSSLVTECASHPAADDHLRVS